MTIREAINFYSDKNGMKGGPNLCKLLGIKESNISQWKKRGYIPFYQQIRIQEFSNGQLKAGLEGRE